MLARPLDGEWTPSAAGTEEALRGALVEQGPWLVHALHIDVDEAWEPLDAVHTWFDMPPFSRMAAGDADE